MKLYLCFRLKPGISTNKAWKELKRLGVEPTYSIEEPNGDKEIYGYADRELTPYQIRFSVPFVESTFPTTIPTINWDDQWAAHAFNYREGFVYVNFNQIGCSTKSGAIYNELKLQPGSGFGDLSHVTTRLTLRLMSELIENQPVLDIGSGSGILSLSALLMGSPFAYGIDIDPAAIEHARKNAIINQMESRALFCLPHELDKLGDTPKVIALINMILSEQKLAWESLQVVRSKIISCISSGIRKEEKKHYLSYMKKQGWQLVKDVEDEGWVAACFSG